MSLGVSMSARQLTLSFTPGLTVRHKSLREITQVSVIKSNGGIAGVAPAVDMSPSHLGRKLAGNADDPHRTLDIDDWVRVVEASGDLTPIYWLIEKFLPSDEQRRAAAVEQLSLMMPQLAALLEDAGVKPKAKR